jgi:hypothetical protein
LALWLSSQVAFHFEAARKRRPRNRPSHANGCAQVLWSKELIERKNSKSNAEPGAEGSVWVESIESQNPFTDAINFSKFKSRFCHVANSSG